MKPLCYLDGRVQSLAEARLDPLDRGFLFGDALYEAVKVLDGTLLHLQPHLDRLNQGLSRVEIPAPETLESVCRQLVEATQLDSGYLYLQVSRGVRSRLLIPPTDLEPTVFVVPFEMVFDAPAVRLKRAVTVPDWRWEFRDIKTTSLMATVLGKLRAGKNAVDEVLFVGPRRRLREGGTTNLFVRHEDAWETHPTDGCILQGVTRGSLLKLAAAAGMQVVERGPSLDEIENWQEAFLCGTTTGVQPLVELDGQRIGDGGAGAWTQRLAVKFDQMERDYIAAAVA
jgi:D-alanine transaminase